MAIICKYKFNSTLCADYLPEFNTEFTGYTKTDVDNGDNTITRTIEHDTLKPTLIRFGNSQSKFTDREKSLLELIECNTSNVTNMDSMFFGCGSLTSLNLSNFNTSKVTNMSAMFYNCNKLTSLDLSNFNTSKVTNMNSMFNGCTSLTSLDLSNFDTIKVNNMGYMFSNCNKLTSLDLSNFNTSNVISMLGMFRTCSSLTSLDVSNFNTSKVNNMRDMFSDCTSLSSLNISNFNTSNVNNMGYMFNGCSSLTSLNLSNFNTSKVQHMFDMFSGCTSLTSLDLSNFNTINVTNMSYMFYDCTSLSDIGMVYCNKATIDKVSLLIQHTANIYVNSVIPENCIPVEGITFIFDGDIKTLYLNSPLLEGDTIEEKDGGIYHVHRSKQVVLDSSLSPNSYAIKSESITNNDRKTLWIIMNKNVFSNRAYKFISDKFINTSWNKDIQGMAFGENVDVMIEKSKLISLDKTGVNDYFSKNPTSVVYEISSPQYELIEQSNLVIPSYANGHLDFDTAVPVEKVEFKPFSEELVYLYPSTSYTVQFMSDKAITVDIALGGTELLAQSIVTGLNRIAVATPATLVDNKLVINGVGANISEVVVTDTNRQFRYFEGMKSVGECEELEVKSCNKNLLDYTQLYDENNFIKTYEIYGFWAYKVKVEKGKTYTVSVGATEKITIDGKTPYLCITTQEEYQKTPNQYKEWINHASLKFDNVVTITSTDGYLYIQVSSDMNKVKSLLDNIGYIQIEEGTTATDYVPYQSNTQQLTHEPLRGVGAVKDRYVIIDGKWYIERDYAEVVLDGSAVSGDVSSYFPSNNSSIFFIRKEDAKSYDNLLACDKFKPNINVSNSENRNVEGVFMSISGSNSAIYLRIFNDKLSTQDINGFKQWLRQNPVTIVYQLAEPVYEPLDYNPLETYADVTHITTNSAIPCNVIVKNHGYNLVALKENTQYTLYVDKDTTNALTYRLGDYIEINSPSKFTFTTPETLTDKTLRIDSKGAKVNDLMLIEGTPTNDSIGCFNGLKSSYECEKVTDENDENYGKYKVDVKVVGKNLISGTTPNSYQNYNTTNNNFSIVTNNKCSVTDFIRVIPGKTYIGTGLNGGGAYYDKNKNPILPMNRDLRKSFTVPTGAYYLVANLWTNPTGEGNIQLEEGTQPTEYEPYFESKQTVYLNSPLLKGDEVVWKDNKIQHYHKMETIVLDGSDDERWFFRSNSNGCSRFYRNDNTLALNPKILCDTLNSDITLTLDSVNEGISGHSSSHEFRIYLNEHRLSTQDVVGLRQWLQANPVTVVYELETPYYEEISDYPLKLNVIANSSLSTESTIQVTNISFNIYEETLPYLYPNTKYYITFNADVDRNNIIINLGGSHTVLDCKVGFNKVEITTPSDTTNLLTFSGTGVNIDHVKVTQQDIDEYFEGMKSVGECEGNVIEIILQNKNLFDGETESGVYSFADGVTVVENDNYSRTVNYINVKDIDKITISSNQTTYGFRVYLYDANKKHIENIIVYSNNSLNVSKASYIRMIYNSKIDKNTIQIETGTEVTSYSSYTSNKQQLTHEPLRAVGNVKDKYIMIDGKWYIERNCKEFILTDSLDYSLGNTSSTPFIQFTFELGSSSDYTTTDKIICNRINTTNVYTNNTNIGICYVKNDTIRIRLTNSDTLDSFKAWLNQDLTVIIYKLQTPIYEPLDYNPFETYADITHISTNSLIPTNMVIKNHGYNCILKPSTKYTISLNKPNGTISAKLGGSAKVDSTNSIFTITTPSTLNDNVLRLSGSGNVKDIMILEGDKTVNTPSYFEGIESVFEQEYDAEKGKYRVTARVEGNGKESSIIFYLNEPLRGTGSAKDKVFIQDSKVVVERNCSSITLDGSKNIHKANTDFDSVNNISFSIDIDNIAPSWANCNNIVCSTLPNVGNRTWKGNMEGITSNDIIILLCISRNKLQTQDVNGFKQWLQANPTKVVYVLAEPVYEEADCDLSKLVLENYENSSLIFESNIPVSANIRYSGEVPVVTQAKALSSKVDNTTLDINENIIPYMCDIDYRIVELQLMNGDTQGEGIELLGIGDIEILGNENVLFNNREDKKHNFSYDMLKRDILSQRYSKEEYRYRLDRYLLANKISDEEYKELEGLLNNGE